MPAATPPARARSSGRQGVDDDHLEIRWAGERVARHHVAADGVREVWDGVHFAAAQEAARARHRGRRLHLVTPPEAVSVARLELDGDYDVAPLDLARYDPDAPHSAIDAARPQSSQTRTAPGFGAGEGR